MVRWRYLWIVVMLICCTAGGVTDAADEHDSTAHAAEYSLAADLSLWGLVAFALFLFTLYKLLGGWAAQSLTEREQNENALIAESEQKNRLAQEMLAERKGRMEAISEEVGERLAEARRDADHTRNDIISVARRESETLKSRAMAEINRTRNQALNDLFSTMAARVVDRTESNMRGRLNEDEHNRLIDEALNHFARS